jgi:polyhydroxybutyrate depolymerase
MKLSCVFWGCLLLLAACGGGGGSGDSGAGAPPTSPYTGTPGDYTQTITVAGVQRSYLLHVPPSYSAASAMPAVVLLHGGQGSAATIGNITGAGGFVGLADRNNFIVITPDSVAGNWDDGRDTITTRTNDVAFIAAALDAVALTYRLDKTRVYATGISNGGMMSFRLGCELAERFAAIATVAANMPVSLSTVCNPSKPMPLAMFSGTADPLMPYAGGSIPLGVGGTVLSASASANFWLNKNGNTAAAQASRLPDTDVSDGMTTDLFTYGSAGSAGELAFYRINGGGHTWPGGTQYTSEALIGGVTKDFSANNALWAFFARHTRP